MSRTLRMRLIAHLLEVRQPQVRFGWTLQANWRQMDSKFNSGGFHQTGNPKSEANTRAAL
jgi:hypothetical protein